MPQSSKVPQSKGSVTLPVGTRHLFTTDEGKYVWWPTLQQVCWIPRGCRRERGSWSLTVPDNNKRGAMRKALRLELDAHRGRRS